MELSRSFRVELLLAKPAVGQRYDRKELLAPSSVGNCRVTYRVIGKLPGGVANQSYRPTRQVTLLITW